VFAKLGEGHEGRRSVRLYRAHQRRGHDGGRNRIKAVLEAAIFGNAQTAEHCEPRYATLIAAADKLGHDDVVRFLTINLNE
jgi:hypothetical protein